MVPGIPEILSAVQISKKIEIIPGVPEHGGQLPLPVFPDFLGDPQPGLAGGDMFLDLQDQGMQKLVFIRGGMPAEHPEDHFHEHIIRRGIFQKGTGLLGTFGHGRAIPV